MEFLKTARDLEIYSVRKAAHFPKRYTFYISQGIAQTAADIHKHCKMANSIYPACQHEAQTRRDLFQLALAETQALISKIEVAVEVLQLNPASIQHWMELIWKEDRLIRAILKSDRKRYASLPVSL